MQSLEDILNFLFYEWTRVEYTWFNTILFGIILVIALFFIIKFIEKLKIEIDRNFIFSLIPFIIYGSTTRALSDACFYPCRPDVLAFFFIAPGIYFTIFSITLLSLIVSLLLFKKNYYKSMITIGGILCLFNLLVIIPDMKNFSIFIAFLIFSFFILLIYILMRFKVFKFLKFEKNYIIVLAHLFDATTTFVGITFFGYYEKLVLPKLLISQYSAFVMFPLKFIVIFVVYMIDKIDDKTTRRMVKLVIFILGISPAIRNFTRILIGT